MKLIINKLLHIASKIFRRRLFILCLIILVSSCDERGFLEMRPVDFYSSETSFITYDHFEAAIYNLYYVFREEFHTRHGAVQAPALWVAFTDLLYYSQNIPNDWGGYIHPNEGFVYSGVWRPAYHLIYEANVIINRIDLDIVELTDEQRTHFKAEASLFRGLCYAMLAHLYGDVPIVLEETKAPRRDYVRVPRMEVYQQSASDLKFAAENLKDIDETEDHRVSNLAAYHILSEVYISLGQWQDAIDAASVVIDHPNTALMTERFGTRVNGTRADGGEIPERMSWARGGDVYWDLFRQGNVNRSTGNTETIWAIQFGYNMPGGGGDGQFLGGPGLERRFNSRLWIANLYNDDGRFVNMIPQANTYYGGRSAGQNRLSHYFFHVIWENSGWDEDIRNSEWNLIRDLKVNNPASDYDGQWIFADNVPIQINREVDTLRNVYPALVAKISNLGDHPQDIWEEDQTVPGTITMLGGPSNTTHRNIYESRLAETYLLRAEAYLGLGDKTAAAEDINTVRRRSNAPEVLPADVDIDYILEERARELYLEEKRLLTLTRLGKLVEVARKHNPDRGNTLYDHNNLFPIPFSEIEKNLEVKMEQNPGY